MKKFILPIIIGAALIIGLIAIFVLQGDDESSNVNTTIVNNEAINKEVNTNEVMIKDNNDTNTTVNENINIGQALNVNIQVEENQNTNESILTNIDTTDPTPAPVATAGKYVNYSSNILNENADQKRVLFFHAGWCPTCRIANTDFENNESEIPSGVVVIKTDYDSEDDLKEKYGVNYQHVFVQIDANGNEITKWNGGGLDNLISKVK